MLSKLFPYVGDFWRDRELLWQFMVRSVAVRYKGSYLGVVWSVLNPLLMLALYVLIFGYIFGGHFGVLADETKADYALGIFMGLTLFQYVSETLAVSPMAITMNPNFVKKVVFPLEILPVANVAAAAFNMLISLILTLAFMLVFHRQIHIELLWLPAIILPLTLFCIGISWLLSALGVFFRDISQLVQFLSMALLYASAVFFATKDIPPIWWMFLKYNPLLYAVEMARATALWGVPMNYSHLLYLYVSSFATFHLGHMVFRKMKPAFADVL